MKLPTAVLVVGIAALVIAGLLSPLASSKPDGLERVAEDLSFIDKAVSLFAGLMPDYSFPGVPEWLAGPLAGFVGTVLTLIVGLILGRAMTGRQSRGMS